MSSDPAWVRRTDHLLRPDPAKVVSVPFLPGEEEYAPGESRLTGVVGRALALSEAEVDAQLARLGAAFAGRHRDLAAAWDAHVDLVAHRLDPAVPLSASRRRLVGACLTQEYALEAVALTNPSMAPHPDQAGLPPGSTRFVMTLRAIGEGHRSSVRLRTGTVDADDVVRLDPPPAVAVLPSPGAVTSARVAPEHPPAAAERAERVAGDTYAVQFPADSSVQERVLLPRSPSESRGIEDVRLVQLTTLDGGTEHVGTYTAYDGHRIRTHLVRTPDLRTYAMSPLSGPGAGDKGLALFPRPVDGRYLALSRADRESNAVTTSADLIHWESPRRVQAPERPWEVVQVGNCGPPLATEDGWLVLTHGVGPMRTYAIGALLLDLDDPTVVRGRLAEPFLTPTSQERSGYVSNVVYSCGAMLHGRTVVLPYGCSDTFTRIALVGLDALLEALRPPAGAGTTVPRRRTVVGPGRDAPSRAVDGGRGVAGGRARVPDRDGRAGSAAP